MRVYTEDLVCKYRDGDSYLKVDRVRERERGEKQDKR